MSILYREDFNDESIWLSLVEDYLVEKGEGEVPTSDEIDEVEAIDVKVISV